VYVQEYTDTSIIVTDLTPGYTYAFVVQSRTAAGLSEYSSEMIVRAAQIPDAPENLRSDPLITDAY
jgi:hypothetical protein